MQTLPSSVTFSKLAVTISNQTALSLVGTSITITAQLYKYSSGSYSTVGSACTLSPAFTGIVGVGATASCLTTGMTASYAAGDAGFVVLSATASGISLVNTVSIAVSTGVQ
jgi:hypothetical protein